MSTEESVPLTTAPASHRLESSGLQVSDLRSKLLEHPLYRSIDDEQRLRTFMEHHVFCVWDFQSLLTALQRAFTCVQVPWTPTSNPQARRLINEVVLEEESDEITDNVYLSHFEYYLQAMADIGASTAGIEGFIDRIRAGESVASALQHPQVPPAAQRFVLSTFATIEGQRPHEIAAVFAYGRENLIPDMFPCFDGPRWSTTSTSAAKFSEYLARHIEYDGERHGPLSERLVATACGNDPRLWSGAQSAARAALAARLELWDRVFEVMEAAHAVPNPPATLHTPPLRPRDDSATAGRT